MVKWRKRWVWVAWTMLGFSMFLSEFVSGNVVMMVVGVVMAFGYASIYLTSYVESDHRIKRALELIFVLLAFGVAVYGYVITGSFILGVITLFIVAMVLFAFVVSYLLPRIRGNRIKT